MNMSTNIKYNNYNTLIQLISVGPNIFPPEHLKSN